MSKKEVILKAAKEMFALNGYEGTVMDELAHHAKVNKATIYYYFKDKQRLYEEVFKSSIESVYNNLKNNLSTIDNPKKALFIYINAFYQQAIEDETFIRILMREVASNGTHFPKSAMEVFLNTVSFLESILKYGYEEGIFKIRDTKMVHFIIIGAISYSIASKPIRETLIKHFYSTYNFLESKNDDINKLYEIVLNGLETR